MIFYQQSFTVGKKRPEMGEYMFSTYSFNPIKLTLGNLIVHDMAADVMFFDFLICMILAGK